MRTRRKVDPLKRFWEKVSKGTPEGCWLWNAGLNGDGYACFWYENQTWRATRFLMYILGRNPENLDILHTCDNPLCVNPDHLFPGTNQDNIKDRIQKGRSRGGGVKLTEEQVLDILARYKACAGARGIQTELAAEYGITTSSVNNIIQGHTWSHIPR